MLGCFWIASLLARVAILCHITVIASEAKQSRGQSIDWIASSAAPPRNDRALAGDGWGGGGCWIASSLTLLAMTGVMAVTDGAEVDAGLLRYARG
jgi:hypothetical protein